MTLDTTEQKLASGDRSGESDATSLSFMRRFNWEGILFPFGLLAIAEVAMRVTGVHSETLATPRQILATLIHSFGNGVIFGLSAETLSAAAGGLLLGSLIGLLLGIVFGAFPRVFELMELTIEVIRPIPSISLLPIALLVFGFGYVMEISLIAKSTIWPVMIMTHAAIAGLHPRLREVALLLEMGLKDRITKLVLPAIIPSLFVGFRLSAGVSLLVAITIEIAANPRGLGYAMMRAEETLRPDLLFALLFWVGVLGWGINGLLLLLQKLINHRFGGAGAR
ncbi:MAG TPA: ABC transporter permease subunit [Ensifer sp.]|nr:ABC transporter permease subunit [Ensifer sp.]